VLVISKMLAPPAPYAKSAYEKRSRLIYQGYVCVCSYSRGGGHNFTAATVITYCHGVYSNNVNRAFQDCKISDI
jgi:hypothetical protein